MMREARERMMQAQSRVMATDAKPWRIGLMVDPIDDTLRSHLEIPEKSGVIVTKCMEDGPASKAGIKENDIILMVNGRPVGSIEPLRDAVEFCGKSGEPLRLTTLRKGQRREVTIRPDMPKPPVSRPAIPAPSVRPPTMPPAVPGNAAPMREQEAMMRRMAEQNAQLMGRLERQEQEMKRLRAHVEEMTKAMREMKRDGETKAKDEKKEDKRD